jgi:ABC-type branched-subunit amino acid transport system substrate-binding protein
MKSSLEKKYEITLNEAFDMGTRDFKNIVAKVKSNKCDVIFVCGFKNHLIQLAKEFNTNGMKKDGNIVFSYDIIDAVNDVDSKVLNGYLANIPTYEIETTDLKTKWEEKFTAKYGKISNYTNAYAYDFAKVMYEIAKQYAKSKESTLDFGKYIFEINEEGVTGNIKFATNGELIGYSKTCKYEDGRFIPLDEK